MKYFLALFLMTGWIQNIQAQQPSHLMLAADRCDHQHVQALIDENHDVNERYQSNGYTPLYFAIDAYTRVRSQIEKKECYATIDILSLHHHLDISDEQGNDVIDYAESLNVHRRTDMSLVIDLLIDNLNALDRRIF